VSGEPRDLRRDVPGVEVAPGQLAQPLRIGPLGDLGALLAGAPVAPDQRRVQRRPVGVGRDDAVELGAE
jgi:hypothetical protein